MSDPSAVAAIQNEKVSIGHEWIETKEEKPNGVQKKLHDGVSPAYRPQPIAIERKAKRKEKGPLEIVCGFIVDHQIGLAVNLLMLLCLTHLCFPRARQHTRKFFELSYHNPKSGDYCVGWNDAGFVSFWIVVFTGLRAAVIDYLLMPFARKGGVKTTRDQTRFAEQAWLLVYYTVFWPLGMYILLQSDYWYDFKNLWTNWPNREISGIRKWYILVQYAFWLQQIMVINIEERRKDYWQMLTHHVVTTSLIFTSYGYHQTKVANLILCVMDIADPILAVAKCLKYLGFTTICDVIFGFFMVTWVAARHVLYLMICWSLYNDIPQTIAYGCYKGKNGNMTGPTATPNRWAYLIEPFHDPEGTVCWNNTVGWAFLSALLFLHCVVILWFTMIVKVLLKVVRGGKADDIRSDDEGDEEIDEHESFEEELQPFEEEVGVESINLKGRVSNASKMRYKSTSVATGVSLPGHSADRKELLGRIGCDKGV